MSEHKSKTYLRKSRIDIEKEVSERKFYEDNNFGNYLNIDNTFPSFIPQIPLMEFDKYAYQVDNIYKNKQEGDVPLEMLESEKSMHCDSHFDSLLFK